MAADLTYATFSRGVLSLKVPSTAGAFAAFQCADITIENGIELSTATIPQLGPYPVGDKLNSKSLKISCNLLDVRTADLATVFNASESTGTITCDGSLIYVGAQLVIALNPNSSDDTLTITIPYAVLMSSGSVNLEDDVHKWPITLEARKQDEATAVATIVLA